MNFKSEAAKYGGAISKIPNGYTQAIGKILEFLAAGIGQRQRQSSDRHQRHK